MTRADQIADLRRRIKQATEERKRKTVSILTAKLLALTTRQLKAEIRESRKLERAA